MRSIPPYRRIAMSCALFVAINGHAHAQILPIQPYSQYKSNNLNIVPLNIKGARSVSEEFFEDIRDSRFSEAYYTLSDNLKRDMGYKEFKTRSLRFYRIIRKSHVDEKFTFISTNSTGLVSCVLAVTPSKSRVYLTALLSESNHVKGWSVQHFSLSSSPSEGCPQ